MSSTTTIAPSASSSGPSGSSSGGAVSWLALVLAAGGVLLILILVSSFVILVFGRVTGLEFSPDTFARRTYFYLRVPGLGWQLSPLTYTTLPGGTESQVAPLVPATTAAQPRWDYVATITEPRSQWRYPAGILLNYLDAGDSSPFVGLTIAGGDSWWGQWTTKNPDLAKVFWPFVADLARHEEYALLPDLFEIAKTAEDATALKRDLERATARLLREEGDRRQANAQLTEAISAYTRSLTLVPLSPATLERRAAAYTTLGDAAKAKADKEKADELKVKALSSELGETPAEPGPVEPKPAEPKPDDDSDGDR